MAEVLNAWGDPVEETEDDPWFTPKEDRLNEDDPEAPDHNALQGGDDLKGWKPGDPV